MHGVQQETMQGGAGCMGFSKRPCRVGVGCMGFSKRPCRVGVGCMGCLCEIMNDGCRVHGASARHDEGAAMGYLISVNLK